MKRLKDGFSRVLLIEGGTSGGVAEAVGKNQRDRLLMGNSSLDRSTEVLKSTARLVSETEDIGTDYIYIDSCFMRIFKFFFFSVPFTTLVNLCVLYQ